MLLTTSVRTRFGCAFFISLGLAFTTPVIAQTIEPKPAVNTGQGTTVTVKGKRKSRLSERLLRHNYGSASSCGFFITSSAYGAADALIVEEIIADFAGSPNPNALASGGIIYNDDGTVSQGSEVTFRETSPFGDASSDTPSAAASFFIRMSGSRSVFGSGEPSGCTAGDAAYVAGRAHIARRDKTLPEAYALFDAKKYAEALEMAKKSYAKLTDAEGGIEASLMIGKIYAFGLHGTADVPEGLEWLERAAGARFDISSQTPPFNPQYPEDSLSPISEAAILMAKIYMTGFGVPKTPKNARRWFERANYVGYVPAAKTLGDIYYYGYDTPKDIKKAINYYAQAAKLGFAPAQYSLAEIYYLGEGSVKPDIETAIDWYNEASKQKHPGALYALAHAYDAEGRRQHRS